MHILIVHDTIIPAVKYGGIERVIWSLGKALVEKGHTVSYLVAKGSYCSFAKNVFYYDATKPFDIQVPNDIDIIHFNWKPEDAEITKPYIVTQHINVNRPVKFDKNIVFISQNHAERHGSNVFVYNGLDWNEYPKAHIIQKPKTNYSHFLGAARWKVKNVKSAIAITKLAGSKLEVLGGKRLNFTMGFRFTTDLHVKFRGNVDDKVKASVMQNSKGLVFPVLWHEPFGLCIIESLFYGCPIFATPYGSLKELVPNEAGFLSNSETELANALKRAGDFDRSYCHDYAAENFNAQVMANNYLKLYEKVLNGESLHTIAPEFKDRDIQKEKYLEMLP